MEFEMEIIQKPKDGQPGIMRRKVEAELTLDQQLVKACEEYIMEQFPASITRAEKWQRVIDTHTSWSVWYKIACVLLAMEKLKAETKEVCKVYKSEILFRGVPSWFWDDVRNARDKGKKYLCRRDCRVVDLSDNYVCHIKDVIDDIGGDK